MQFCILLRLLIWLLAFLHKVDVRSSKYKEVDSDSQKFYIFFQSYVLLH